MLLAQVYQLSRSYGVIEDNNMKRLFPRTVSYLVNFMCFMTIMVGNSKMIFLWGRVVKISWALSSWVGSGMRKFQGKF